MTQQPIIRVAVPPGTRWDDEIQKAVHESLPYYVPEFDRAAFESEYVDVVCSGNFVDVEQIRVDIEGLVAKIAKSFRDVTERSIFRSESVARLTQVDPFEVLVANRSVVQTGRGKFAYGKDFLRLFNAFDRLIEAFCLGLGAKAELYPSTVQSRSLIESGYLRSSPHLAFFVTSAHLERTALMRMTQPDIADPTQRLSVVKNLGVPSEVLAPTVCYHCFEARKQTSVGSELVTALNRCHRHEIVNVDSLERLTTYWMRELIVFGDQSTVQSTLDAALDFTVDLLAKWGVWYEVKAANDPFFAELGAGNRMYQSAFELKRELKLPAFSGKAMAVASFNNHQHTLVDKFGVTSSGIHATPLASGCVGWGYERFLYGLYSQLGADLMLWPKHIRQDLAI